MQDQADKHLYGMEPPTAAMDWLRMRLGKFAVVTAYRQGGRRNGVWRLRNQREDFIFKLHNRRSHWSTESFVYANWRKAFAPKAAELIASLDSAELQLFGLLLSYVDAQPLRELELEPTAEASAYREAGALLRKLHDLDRGSRHGSPTIDGGIAGRACEAENLAATNAGSLYEMADTAERLCCMSPDQLAMVRNAAETAAMLPGEPAIPTHPDYTPGNWLVNKHGLLIAVIDFENMTWGSRHDPLVRLTLDYFESNPMRRQAFDEGYGENLVERYADRVRVGRMIYAAYYAILGAENGDAGHAMRANRAFDILLRNA